MFNYHFFKEYYCIIVIFDSEKNFDSFTILYNIIHKIWVILLFIKI
jgi:hypothetical protein